MTYIDFASHARGLPRRALGDDFNWGGYAEASGKQAWSGITSGQNAGTVTVAVAKTVAVTVGVVAAGQVGAAAGAAACAATGVGAALAPLCGMLGSAIGAFLASEVGPLIDDIGNAIGSLFSDHSETEKALAHAANVRVLLAQVQFINGTMAPTAGVVLRDALKQLAAKHDQLFLPGVYGTREGMKALQKFGVELIPDVWSGTTTDPTHQTDTSWIDPISGVRVVGERALRHPDFDPAPALFDYMRRHPDMTADNAQYHYNEGVMAHYTRWVKAIQAATAGALSDLGTQRMVMLVQQKQLAAAQRAKEMRAQYEGNAARAAKAASDRAVALTNLQQSAATARTNAAASRASMATAGIGALAVLGAGIWFLKRPKS